MNKVVAVSAGVLGVGALSYGACAALSWRGYGRTPELADGDPLAERFMPNYDVRHEQHIRVHAPAEIAMRAIHHIRRGESFAIRSLFRMREAIMRARPVDDHWSPLAEIPGRELVFGAATRPWLGNVMFRGLSPSEFASFDEPEYVKILWTLRVDPVGTDESVVRTETRAVATDARSRAAFRSYWAFLFPGMALARRAALSLVRLEARRLTMSSA